MQEVKKIFFLMASNNRNLWLGLGKNEMGDTVVIRSDQWDPMRGVSWATLLGMVHVPMFGMRKTPRAAQEAAILLDGPKGSFAFLATNDNKFAQDLDPVSWSWSSCVRHTLAVVSDRMYLRRWDEPETFRKFAIPTHGNGAISLLAMLEAAPQPRRPDVIRHILEPFRQIRTRIGASQSLLAVKLLNALLLVAEVSRKTPSLKRDAVRVKTFGEALQLLSEKQRALCGLVDVVDSTAGVEVVDLVRRIVNPDPYTGCELHPTLLFSHAASKLYQEAHLEIERNPQPFIPGLEGTNEPIGDSPRDVRFTPANLARALVQKALEVLPDHQQNITILDPACGSGIFLVEAIRELSSEPTRHGRVIKAVGYDISDISEYTTRFCLEYATQGKGNPGAVKTEVVKCDSLDRTWVSADIILMNPPFISWHSLSEKQKRQVTEELGGGNQQRPDIAMAFVSRAVRSLKAGGVLGCVLPASLLGSQSGLAWREQLSEGGSLRLIGCFEGYKYFPTSLVETAFLIYRKNSARTECPPMVEVLISDEGSENAALRALRLEPQVVKISGVDRFTRAATAFAPENWRPLRQADYDKKDRISGRDLPRASDLFEIMQGVRPGHSVFVIQQSQYEELDRKERKFFRPAAGGGSIRDAQLRCTEYLFYPYATDGSSLFTTEEEVRSKLPTYYNAHLKAERNILANRPRFANRKWWELSEKRAWQTTLAPHLISTYFGESGSFAFDELGDYVTVNGHAWFWKNRNVDVSDNAQIPFEQTPAVWAYLAFLNSSVFENIVSLFSVRLQGGQMRLERRYLAQIPIPDLTDETQCAAGATVRLIELGKEVHAGKLKKVVGEIDKVVSLFYD